jgi:HD-GYP domain-containing protein (c-di-GMP phosphodiesterase class II)
VADTVEAVASHRPYRPALGLDKAPEEIRDGSGTRYDVDLVAACLKVRGSAGSSFGI